MTQTFPTRFGGALIGATLVLTTGACTTVPTKRLGGGGPPESISTSLINRLVCEIGSSQHLGILKGQAASPSQAKRSVGPSSVDGRTTYGKYDIEVQLTVTAETSAGLTPNLNFIHPFATDGLSRTVIAGGELSRKGSRTVTENFTIDVAEVDASACSSVADRVRGSFGVTELIDHQLGSRALPRGVASAKDGDDVDFGSTIEFSVTVGVNGGPHWVRTKFVGPGDGGLANASRTDTNGLVIAFSKQIPADPDAAKANARRLLDRMILQNLSILPRR